MLPVSLSRQRICSYRWSEPLLTRFPLAIRLLQASPTRPSYRQSSRTRHIRPEGQSTPQTTRFGSTLFPMTYHTPTHRVSHSPYTTRRTSHPSSRLYHNDILTHQQGKAKKKAWQKVVDDGVNPKQAEQKYVALVNELKDKYGYDPKKSPEAVGA